MTPPRVNLNGTSKASLIRQHEEAAVALQMAVDALRVMMPHGRDYQTMELQVYRQAREEHIARLRRVDDVREEIVRLWEEIDGQ